MTHTLPLLLHSLCHFLLHLIYLLSFFNHYFQTSLSSRHLSHFLAVLLAPFFSCRQRSPPPSLFLPLSSSSQASDSDGAISTQVQAEDKQTHEETALRWQMTPLTFTVLKMSRLNFTSCDLGSCKDSNFLKSPWLTKNTFTDWMFNILEALDGTFQAIPYFCRNGYAACLIFHAQGCIKELVDA